MRYSIKILFFVLLVPILLSSCTRNKRRPTNTPNLNTRRVENVVSRNPSRAGNKTVIKMQKQGGVYYVPCKINGVEMEFIFDTGASDITMSAAEAVFLLKQGKLDEEDFVGTQQYRIADGSVHEGMVVMLKSVEIGGRRLEKIRASIVDNMEAPLLLGQSALSKFGKISIDYNRNEIIFE